MKKSLLLILSLLSIRILMAQNVPAAGNTVTGKVTDVASGEALIAVTVQVKGTTTGAQTDANGNFTVAVPPNGTLVVSYLGYESQEVPVNNQTSLTIQLAPSARELEQVVVVGYGAQRKRDLTGAVSNVQGADIAKQPIQTPTQAVQGRVAGVQVISSGSPNSQPQVRIRGTGSIEAGVNPLYVVDGVLTNDIRNINNADIVSMDILKDASAAIYGVRAANGVIIITTKKGQAGEFRVEYSGTAGINQATRRVQMADRDQYIGYINDLNTYQQSIDPGASPVVLDRAPLTYGGTTDWYNEILRNAFQTSHNVSVGGGTEKNTFFFSANYRSEEGIVIQNKFKRFTFRANNDVNISKKLKLGTILSFSRGNIRDVNFGSAYNSAYRAAPIIPARENNRYGNTSAFGNVGNPLIDIEKNNVRNIQNRLQGTLSLDYNPVDFIKIRSAFNTDVNFYPERTYNYQFLNDETTFITAGGNQQNQNSNLTVRENRSLNYVWDNTVTFDKDFGEHSFTFLLGSVTEQGTFNSLEASRINVPPNEDQWYLGLGDPNIQSTNNSTGDLYTRQSFVSRLNYDYAGRYLLTAMLRADGSSKFRDKYGYFPTVGVGWVLSEENFMKENSFFNFLKFRGSYGLLGNDNIPTGEYTVFGVPNIPYFFNSGLVLGTAITQIKDVNLKWESTEQLDVGLEFTILNNQLSGEVDYYNKKVNDALVRVPLPGILGADPQNYLTNLGSFRNRGVEFTLNWSQEISQNFRYNIGGNITYNQNKLLNLNQGQDIFFDVTRTTNNQPVGSFFVLNNIGVFQTQEEIDASPVYGDRNVIRPGDLKYEDINDDKVIDGDDRIFAGSYQPKYYYGFNGGITFNNIDFSADFYGNLGNKIYNGKKGARNQITDNIEADFADNRWRPDNLTNSDPARILSNTPASTYFIESGSFLRLNNLTLGYTLPASILQKANINTLRLYVTGQNVFTLTRYSGFTPELPGTPDRPLSAGNEIGAFPSVRYLAFGVNVGF